MTNLTNLSAIGATAATAAKGVAAPDPALAKAAKAFEAIFVRQLIGSMREATDGEDDLTGSDAVKQFQELSDAKTAESIADHDGLGIAKLLLHQLSRPTSSTPGPSGITGAKVG